MSVGLVVLAGCGSSAEESSATSPQATSVVSAQLPDGWQWIQRPVNGVTEPAQALAASSFPVADDVPPSRGCSPNSILDQMPADGAFVQVVESTQGPGDADHPQLRKYPRRPASFRLDDRYFATYECSGRSYNISFRDHHRAFQAFVWLKPNRVDPQIRAQAIDLLDSLQVP